MQEFQPVPGAAGRLFGVGAAAAVPEEVRCPRCDSANTKFCYYNNYNLAQPRHFCRGCRRYWTKGGLLRNVPVGGACRKPKRQVTASSSDGDVHRDVKNARSGSTGTDGSSSPAAASSGAASTTSSTVGAAAATAAHSSGGSATAAGVCPGAFAADTPPPPPPRPRPMFADQAAAFASFFVSPPLLPLPATSFSSQPKADEDVAVAPARAPAEQQSPSASSTADVAPFSARSGGAAMASAAADWQPSTVIDAGMFDVLAGDTSSYDWNTVSWTTDPDGTMYLP